MKDKQKQKTGSPKPNEFLMSLMLGILRLNFHLTEDEENNTVVLDLAVYRQDYEIIILNRDLQNNM